MNAAKDASYNPFAPAEAPSRLVSASGQRIDGRGLEEFRPPFLQVGTNSQASGSAYVEFNNTKVMAAVYGPRQTTRGGLGFSTDGFLQVDLKTGTFSRRQRGKFGQSQEEKEGSALVQRALEPSVQLHTFPKATVDVYILVLESGGSDLACAITCASLALADAGVELYDLVAGSSVSLVGEHLLLDPAASESAREDAGMLVAYMPQANQVTQVVADGAWPGEASAEGLEQCVEGCRQLDAVMREALRERAAAA